MGVPTTIAVYADPDTQHVSGLYRNAPRRVNLDKIKDHFLPGVSVYLSVHPVDTTTYRGRPVRRASTTAKDGYRFAGVIHPLQRRVKQTLMRLKVAKIKIVSSGVTFAWNVGGSLKFPSHTGMMIKDGGSLTTLGLDLGKMHQGEIPVKDGSKSRLTWSSLHRMLLYPAQLRRLAAAP